MKKAANGFVIAATVKKQYFAAAVVLAESIRDFIPDANITLFTEDKFLDGMTNLPFDNVVTDCPITIRTKLYALWNSPYEKTCYLDADMEVIKEGVTGIFDLLDDDNDIAMTKVNPAVAAQTHIMHGTVPLIWHCGMFIYHTERMRSFMKEWDFQFHDQRENPTKYPGEIKDMRWDQTTFARLLATEYKDVKIKELDTNWNFIYTNYLDPNLDTAILYHYILSGTGTGDETKWHI